MSRPARFDYVAPDNLNAVIEVLHGEPEATILAGGQSLLPAMNLRLTRPSVLVDINGVEKLGGTSPTYHGLRLGALTRHRSIELSKVIQSRVPVLAEAAAMIGDPCVRRRGTLGGSLAYADPGAELPVVAVLLQADIEVTGTLGARTVSAAEFFLGPHLTVLKPAEVLSAVSVPSPLPGEGCAIRKFAAQRHGAKLTAAARVRLDNTGRCTGTRLVLGGVAERPLVLDSGHRDLVGASQLSNSLLASIARKAGREATSAHRNDGSLSECCRLVEVVTAAAVAAAWVRSKPETRQ
ncbi:FAD binding domain-containing protein [Streptomyces sp. NPDC053431]|uniref:FAD binding domain-containing protein n=1 Tax=Streptomyces sp. NPDC053431 TaxID=3365703 RepID=UPI0037D0A2D4